MYQARKKRARILGVPASLLRTLSLVIAPAAALVLVGVLLFGDLVPTVSGGVPVESVSVEDVRLSPAEVELRIRNDGQVPVTIGQIVVDDAFWSYSVGDRTLDRLESTTIRVAYPWQEAVPLHVAVLTSTGTVLQREIGSPSLTPATDAATLGMLALIGLGMAGIPVALGLLWLPALRRASPRTTAAVLAFTLGLLTFLLADSAIEGIGLAGRVGEGLNGIGVFVVGALGALAVFAAVESAGRFPEAADGRQPVSGLRLAWLVSAGIGLHNLGEGLAVGTAMRIGEVALGTALVVGFAVHNLTEGVAIATPLGQDAGRVPAGTLVLIAAAAGLPAIPGLWLGALSGGVWAVLGLGIAAGAIAQVVFSVGRLVRGHASATSPLTAASFIVAVVFMYATGLLA